MSKKWRWFLPAYALLAPLALAYVLFLYVTLTHPTGWRWHEGVLTCVSKRGHLPFNAGGQGWSWVVAFATEEQRQRAELRAHEYTHVAQEFACSMVGFVGLVAATSLGAWKIGLILAAAGTGIFHVVYGATLLYALLTGRGWGFEHRFTWSGNANPPATLKAYRSVPWEIHAYETEDEYRHGLHAEAWGSGMLH